MLVFFKWKGASAVVRNTALVCSACSTVTTQFLQVPAHEITPKEVYNLRDKLLVMSGEVLCFEFNLDHIYLRSFILLNSIFSSFTEV